MTDCFPNFESVAHAPHYFCNSFQTRFHRHVRRVFEVPILEESRRRSRNFHDATFNLSSTEISLWATLLETRYILLFREFGCKTRNEKPTPPTREPKREREILVFDNSSASSSVDWDPASDLYRHGMNHPRRQKEPDKYITVCRCREITKIRA